MAITGRRIINLIELWSIAGSGGLEICVSSTSFQINDNGWPQQPRTEKVLKFHMIFHDSTQKNFFSNNKNKGEFKCLDDSKVLSSDFLGLEISAASMTSMINDLSGLNNGLNDLDSLISSKNLQILMV